MSDFLTQKGSIKKLGFGLMRLPQKADRTIDVEETTRMVDHFMKQGFTYFDTAYTYDGSEEATKAALTSRYPRGSYQLVSKFPMSRFNPGDDKEALFQTSLDRCGVEYFDLYLLHSLNAGNVQKAEDEGVWDYFKQLKAEGRIHHIGFSFHDSAELLEDILKKHPETEAVQLQMNYLDWEDNGVQAHKCYDVCVKYGKPVIVMEPIKGGSLNTLTPEIREMLHSANPDVSAASWAMRFVCELDNVLVALSGMSTFDQVVDNCSYLQEVIPLTEEEHALLTKVTDAIHALPFIPCTQCGYCVAGCPKNIHIPFMMEALNTTLVFDNKHGSMNAYDFGCSLGGKPADCIQCGKCVTVCPQHLDIPQYMQQAAEIYADC